MARLLVSAYSIAIFAMLVMGAYPSQPAQASSHVVLDGDSCLALGPSAKAAWNGQQSRCTIQGTLILSAKDMLTVGQGMTLAIGNRAKITNDGVINNAFGATVLDRGKITNAGTITNMGNVTLSGVGSLANDGLFVNAAYGVLKNLARITNTGTITNYANATIINSAKFTNRADVSNAGYIENRGTFFMLENSTLSGDDGSIARNTGNIMSYCGSLVTQAVSVRQAIDRCDDPPLVAMGAWSPDGQGSVDTTFTFYANATDDMRLARLEWDFDGDGVVDYNSPLIVKAARMVSAIHAYEGEGTYGPQVRAVDSAGQKSIWAKGGSLDITAENAVPVAHNATLTVDDSAVAHIMLNATDVDGDMLQYYVLVQPAHGLLSGNAPDLTYQPDDGYSGQDAFGFVASDGKDDSEVATVTITVNWTGGQVAATEQQAGEESAPNNNPVAYSQAVQAMEDGVSSFTLTASDPDGDWLQYSILSDPLHGMLSGSAPYMTYVPDAEYFGQDSVTFLASDSFGGSSTATVTISVTSVNDMPAAYDDSASTAQGVAVTIPVLDNDEDVETEMLVITSTSTPQGGATQINGDESVTYIPYPEFSGSDYFTYTISDGEGGSATAGVAITVNAVQQEPPAPDPVPEPAPVPEPQPAPAAELYCGKEITAFSSVIRGTDHKETLVGTGGHDLILGFGGDDTIRGKGGNDCIMGGAGDDNMWGGDGSDEMHGENGNDKVIGDDGPDLVYGDAGEDRLWGGSGDDMVYGGSENDKLVGDSGSDQLFGEAGDDKLDGGDGRDLGFDVIGDNKIVSCERR